MSLLGQSVIGSLETVEKYSPWFSSGSDAATFLLQIQHQMSGVSITVTIQHKNTEEADSAATTAATFSSASGIGTYAKAASGLKELVRFRFDISASSDAWMHFRMLPPIWQPN